MGAVGKQWNATRGPKEVEHCWCGRVTEWVRLMNVCKILPSVPGVGSILWVHPAQLQWTHDKIQRLSTCERRLEDVETELRRGIFLPSALRLIEIGRGESK